MIDATRIASAGMAAASARLDDVAGRTAALATTAGAGGLPGAAAFSLSDAALDLIAGRASFDANAAVLRVADATTKRLLDLRV